MADVSDPEIAKGEAPLIAGLFAPAKTRCRLASIQRREKQQRKHLVSSVKVLHSKSTFVFMLLL